MAAPKLTIGVLIDRLHAKKEEISELEARKKSLGEERDQIELQVIEAMEKQDTTSGAGKMAAATVGDKVTPQPEDWDKIYAYIHENRFYHLLHRRLSSPGCLELMKSGEIPGVVKFTKKQINLRSL
jgi:hypothetical protein